LATLCTLLLPQPADHRDFLAALTVRNPRLCPRCKVGVLLRTQVLRLPAASGLSTLSSAFLGRETDETFNSHRTFNY
jgi:hypothetical protein